MSASLKVVSEAQARVGTTLGDKYTLDRLIGVGGMAAVYAATHRNRNRVAVKVLHRVVAANGTVRTRFLREGFVANTVDHPGAVRVLDEEALEDGTVFLVMELLEGRSLEERCLHGEPLSLDEALGITDQLLDVLASAHEKGIVHRDIKPDNVFLLTNGTVKVLDFGIARLSDGVEFSDATASGALMGTPGYMAPELALGRTNHVDARTDVFAVGATLFRVLTGGYVQAEATNPAELVVHAATRPAPSLGSMRPGFGPAVIRLVDCALQFDKGQRWPEETITDFAVFEGVEPVLRCSLLEAVQIEMPRSHQSASLVFRC